MNLGQDLNQLIEHGIIDQETADRINQYYAQRPSKSGSLLVIIFGILGAILVGLGIILLIAHNWDEFSRSTKTMLAFLPLIIGQVFCGYALLKKNGQAGWIEGASTFLFLAIGASISLISQIYHIPGDISSFLISWLIAGIPLVYVLRASMPSLLAIVLTSYYAVEAGYNYPSSVPYNYWLFMLAILPHYYLLWHRKAASSFTALHHWLVALSLIISLGTFSASSEEFMMLGYFCLFSAFYLLGLYKLFDKQRRMSNAYRILGALGMIIIMFSLSFDWFWNDLRGSISNFTSIEFWVALILFVLCTVLFYSYQQNRSSGDFKPLAPMFLLFTGCFILGYSSGAAMVIMNLLILATGVLTVFEGSRREHLGVLNFGMLVLAALVICRFFDTNISFVIRGLMFLIVGVGFFAVNLWTLKKRKTHA